MLTSTPLHEDDMDDKNWFSLFESVQDRIAKLKHALTQAHPETLTTLDDVDLILGQLYAYTQTVGNQTSEFIDTFKAQNAEYKTALEKYTNTLAAVEELNKTNSDLREQVKMLKDLNISLQEQVKALKEILDETEKRMNKQEKQIDKLTTQVKDYVGQIQSLQLQSKRQNQEIGKLRKSLEQQEASAEKCDRYAVVGEVAFQFEKYVSSYLFPRENPVVFSLKIKHLDKLVAEYVSKHFPNDKENQTHIIQDKIEMLGLRKLVNCDADVKKLKDLRLPQAHKPITRPKDYPIDVIKAKAKECKAEDKVEPLLNVLTILAPDGLPFIDVFSRDFKDVKKQ